MVNSLINALDNPFWRFSLKVYQDEKVKETCLSFQNSEGVNVNLLLLCCWLSYAVENVSQIEFKKACRSIANWQQQVTQPLRMARQHLKSMQENSWVGDFYQQILADELTSEAYQQHSLYLYFADKQKPSAAKNKELMHRYLYWLFDEMKIAIDNALDLRIRYFVQITIAKVNFA